MAKMGLDAICAKLSRNAEMTSKSVNAQQNNNDDDAAENTSDTDKVDGRSAASVAASAAERAPVSDEAASAMDSGEEAVADVDSVDSGRRARRKNFLPRCVQDGLVIAERASAPRSVAASTTTSAADVDDDAVLDLRTDRRSSSQRTSDRRPIERNDDSRDQVLDLSVSRCLVGVAGMLTMIDI